MGHLPPTQIETYYFQSVTRPKYPFKETTFEKLEQPNWPGISELADQLAVEPRRPVAEATFVRQGSFVAVVDAFDSGRVSTRRLGVCRWPIAPIQ
jgi:hypothetical protein